MSDIIKILPDSVANQIAAGEVVQRPASVVKELLENSIDSGAKDIKLIIKDAGRTLIQVIDNGNGMSETDARLCFERHATSKIKESKDLFSITTMGFRGEALASIAAIAQVELKTKKANDTLGTSIIIEGSTVKSQEVCSCQEGTSISVKNIFYNVPARRNFLKSDQVELNHIIEEFHRVVLAMPEVAFSFYHNDKELFHLQATASLKQRISAIFGKNYNERLLPVEQETSYIKITGFLGKPEFAKKNRGEQYFFVNNRFIKHSYLNHAVTKAYLELVSSSTYPSYFIYFDIDPKTIDINIHPTKTEIKFQDERMIYAVLLSAVKLSLGKFNITPTIDFEVERSFDLPHSYKNTLPVTPKIKFNPDYNPFDKPRATDNQRQQDNLQNWEKLYEQTQNTEHKTQNNLDPEQQLISPEWDNTASLLADKSILQINERYILTKVKSGLLIIDHHNAYERIYYENFMNDIDENSLDIQQQLFPQQIELSTSDSEILKQILDDIKQLGFDIAEFSKNTFVVNGLPAIRNTQYPLRNTHIPIPNTNVSELIEGFIETYKNGLSDMNFDKNTNLARSLAKNIAKKTNRNMSEEEMLSVIDELFACKLPDITPDGRKTFTIISFDELENRLK